MVAGDADLLGQMLVNVLDNVVTHTPRGTHARLSLASESGFARITVADDGPGLAEATARAWCRRSSARPRRKTRGSGLGLAIVQAIVRFHGGTLRWTMPAGSRRPDRAAAYAA